MESGQNREYPPTSTSAGCRIERCNNVELFTVSVCWMGNPSGVPQQISREQSTSQPDSCDLARGAVYSQSLLVQLNVWQPVITRYRAAGEAWNTYTCDYYPGTWAEHVRILVTWYCPAYPSCPRLVCRWCPPYIIQQLLPFIPAQHRALAWEQLGHRRSAVLPPATFRQCTLFWLLPTSFNQFRSLFAMFLLASFQAWIWCQFLFFCILGSYELPLCVNTSTHQARLHFPSDRWDAGRVLPWHVDLEMSFDPCVVCPAPAASAHAISWCWSVSWLLHQFPPPQIRSRSVAAVISHPGHHQPHCLNFENVHSAAPSARQAVLGRDLCY